MTKKRGLILAAMAVAAFAAGAAVAAGMNLFERFGAEDARLGEIAPDAGVATASPVTAQSEKLGQVKAYVDSGYYDGSSLLVGYVIENGSRVEEYAPTEEELAEMQKEDGVYMPVYDSAEAEAIRGKIDRALEDGTPFGYVSYSVDAADGWRTEDGVELSPTTENPEEVDGVYRAIREFESPLPTAALDRDSITVCIPLDESTFYWYFDGTDCYNRVIRSEGGEITATIPRADGESKAYSGDGVYGGTTVEAQINLSAVVGTISITAPEGTFARETDDLFYDLLLVDEVGRVMRIREISVDGGSVTASFDGSGILPGEIRVYVTLTTEEEWDPAEILKTEPNVKLYPAG